MPPTPYHRHRHPQQPPSSSTTTPNLPVLFTFAAALSDLSALKPTLLALRHAYLNLETELRAARSRVTDLKRKNDRLESDNKNMQRECAAVFAWRLNAQNEGFMEGLSKESGISFEGFDAAAAAAAAAADAAADSPMWFSAAAGRGDGVVVGEVWRREGRFAFVWVRREDGGLGRIDGVAGVTRERVVGGWESWKKGLGRRVGEKRKGWRARLVDKRESLLEDLREMWRWEGEEEEGGGGV